MATDIIRSLSGIRGLVDGPLTAFEAYKTARAYFEVYLRRFIQPDNKLTIIIGKDPKASGNALVAGVQAAFADSARSHKLPLTIHYLGVTTSPTLAWAVTSLKAAGGVNFTASHNPIEWNGIKLIAHPTEHATLLNAGWMARINERLLGLDREISPAERQNIEGSIAAIKTPVVENTHVHRYNRDVVRRVCETIDACAGQPGLGCALVDRLRNTKLTVVADGCCVEGGNIVAEFLTELGVARQRVMVINTKTIEESERRLEPAPPYLDSLRAAIAAHRADIGFAVDPDQDRLVAMPLESEEYSPLLAAKFLFELQKNNAQKHIKSACVNLSTTGAWEEVAEELGVTMVRTPIGEVNVAQGMIEHKTVLGAEGNGGVLLAPVNYGRNSSVAMALLLLYMVHRDTGLAGLARELPPYLMIKDKMTVPDPVAAVQKVTEHYQTAAGVTSVDVQDGCKVLFADRSWVQVRASNTEPIIRVFAEVRCGADMAVAAQLAQIRIDETKKIVA